MKKTNRRNFCIAGCFFLMFLLWTMAIQYVDVQEIGPKASYVGFATLNNAFFNLTGVHMMLYTITDWLGLVPLIVVLGFALLGLGQLIKNRSMLKVDRDILLLGGFYIIVMVCYMLFEIYVVNYRPVLIDGYLEASYPSSTALLVMCVMPTTILQCNARIKNQKVRKAVKLIILTFIVFMVIGRLVSGVHWLTDIIGGVLLSTSLVMLYHSIRKSISK